MSKFSIFTLFLSATLLVVMGELLTHKYLQHPFQQKQLQVNTFQNQEKIADKPAPIAVLDEPVSSKLNLELLKKSGFVNVSVTKVDFKGILFESIDLKNFKSVPIFQTDIREKQQKIAVIYEFIADSNILADEVYSFLKEKSGKILGASINATDSFLERSFYVNYLERKETAFLVVKIQKNVYALSYKKVYHSYIKKLISLFS